MDIMLRERKKGFLSFLKRKKTINVDYKRTIGKVLGIGGGYKTTISADRGLAEEGKVKNLISLLTRGDSNEPFSIPSRSLDGYDLVVYGTARELRVNKGFLRALRREVKPEYRSRFDEYVKSFVGWFSLEIGETGIKNFKVSEPALLYKPFFYFLQK